MTVIIHSPADAALADGPHRHPPTRSPSSVTLPPISTLVPAASLPTRASRSSPPKLSSRDQTLLGRPSVNGWSLCPLQGLQLDKKRPEWSIHGWHEDAQRLLQPPQAMTPSNVYVKFRPISPGAYSSGSQFDKSSRAHPPPGRGENMDSTSETFASPSLQAKTLHPLPLRPINSEVKLMEKSYRFIMYGTKLTEQENHAMAHVLDTGKESSGPRTNVGRSPSEKCNLLPLHQIVHLAVTPLKVKYYARKTGGHLQLPDLPPPTLLLVSMLPPTTQTSTNPPRAPLLPRLHLRRTSSIVHPARLLVVVSFPSTGITMISSRRTKAGRTSLSSFVFVSRSHICLLYLAVHQSNLSVLRMLPRLLQITRLPITPNAPERR